VVDTVAEGFVGFVDRIKCCDLWHTHLL
jgi:hypothetical protein